MDKYYDKASDITSYEVFVGYMSGLIESLNETAKLTEFRAADEFRDSFFFRGQKDYKWELTPSLFRERKGVNSWKQYGGNLLHEFKRQSLPHLPHLPSGQYDTPTEWRAIAQHHGLPTNLLDWSTSPMVALYFATEYATKKVKGVDGTFKEVAVDGSFWFVMGGHNQTTFEKREVVPFYFPASTNRFIEAQSACFSVHNYPDGYEPFPSPSFIKCVKFIVKKECKASIRQYLKIMGIHEFSVYPSLTGLAKYLSK